MIRPFDIYRLEKGMPLWWIAAFRTLEEARSYVRAAGKPRRYVIHSIHNRHQEYIEVDEKRSAAGS